MSLPRSFRAVAAAISMVAAAAAPVAAEAPASGGSGLTVRVGQAQDFSRVEFHWAGRAGISVRRDGQTLTVAFNRDAQPDLADLLAPLKWVKSVKAAHKNGVISFVFTLADDADAKVGEADGADFVNIFQKKAPDAAGASAAAPSPAAPPTASASARPDPVPPNGVVPMRVTSAGDQLRLDFGWRNPCGAAVFRRGDAIWVVFDAAAKLDLSQAPKNAVQFASIQTIAGPGYTALRIATREPEDFAAEADGSDWAVMLRPQVHPPFTPIGLARDDLQGPAALTATVAGASGVFWIADPAVGDKIAVVTAPGPVKGLPSPHDYVEFSLMASAQGLAVDPHVDDLSVAANGDIVTIGRPKGLVLSAAGANAKMAAAAFDAPKAAAVPGLIDPSWAKVGDAGFAAREDVLMAPAADEKAKGLDGATDAHMAFARFLVGSELSFEAIGVLDDAFKTHPGLGGDAEFRALRGMARVMARRYQEAETDLTSPTLDDNPAASLWRGYVFAHESRWQDARREYAAGARALDQFSPAWKARFSRSAAETALQLGDVAGASSFVNYAIAASDDPAEQAESQLVAAQVSEREGDLPGALANYQSLAQNPLDSVSGPALMHATQIQLRLGQVTPAQAVSTFDVLRYRWRGGAFELEDIRALGQLYISQGRYREALEALRSAGQELPDLPEAVQIQADLSAAFRYLFLGDGADGLQPVQALALFYDFKELTPVGEDGDAMVRKLTRRLVDVDLLPQAEQLLKYQVENRLEGVSKGQVATDLAVIYLMDQQPEAALDAINESRTTVLPNALNLQRRIVAARAMTGLGLYDNALEMLGADTSIDAQGARAEVYWRQKAWPQAGALFEKLLNNRYKAAGPLGAEQEGQLLRAAVAYSLAEDDASLARLRAEYGPFVDNAHNPDALRVALLGVNQGGQISLADFSRISADNQTFAGWVDRMKQHFRDEAPPAVRPPVSLTSNRPPPVPPAGKTSKS